jgi:hypothetical protein
MSKNNVSTKTNELVSLDVVSMNGKDAGETLKLYDTKLIEHTNTISKYRDAGNMSILAIANEMAKIENDKSYEKAGFKSVAEYANVVFDYKRPTVVLYLKCAKAFLTDDENGIVTYRSNLPKFTIGQLIELLPMVKNGNDISQVIDAIANGDINNRMSTKAVRKAVQSVLAIESTATETKSEKSATERMAKLDENNLPKKMENIQFVKLAIESALENVSKAIKKYPDCGEYFSETINNDIEKISTSIIEVLSNINAKTENTNK